MSKILKTGVVQMSGDSIGANLLKNTDTYHAYSTSQDVASYSAGGWGVFSGGNGTGTWTEIGSPFQYYFGIYNNTSGNRDWCQRLFPFVVGQAYTISGFVRVASSSSSDSVTMLTRVWDNTNGNSNQLTISKKISNKDWEYFYKNFTYNGSASANVQFGISGAGAIEYCGVKLELGSVPTPWVPYVSDEKHVGESYGFIQSTVALPSITKAGTTIGLDFCEI